MTQQAYSGQVLIVDDDPIMAEMLEAELEESGFRCAWVADLPGLRAKIRERSYDAVLVDLFLENADGLEALPILSRESPHTKIVMMSAHGTIELAVTAMEKGACTFLSKSKNAREMVQALKARLGDEPLPGKDLGANASDRHGIIGNSPAVRDVLERVEKFKNVDSTVLCVGESGTGKELVARAIHQRSSRADKRFEAINCGAIPGALLESELFGHQKGAFTDAKTDRKGLFELCQGGTIFLDEIGEMPLNLQVKLLRVLQEKEVMPLGASRSIPVDARVVAATNRNLVQEVQRGAFREDLFYRLNVLEIRLPTLRERSSDIPLLVTSFLKHFNERFGKQVQAPSREIEAKLLGYSWPGNIRQLRNAVERAVVLSGDGKLRLEDLLPPAPADGVENTGQDIGDEYWLKPLSEAKQGFEKAYLQHLLEVTRGNISEMARISGRYRTDIYRLLAKYDVQWEEFRN